MDCIDSTNKTIRILGIHSSYNKKLENQEEIKRLILKIEKELKLWRMRNLTIKEKIVILKTLVISKIVHLPALITDVLTEIINELNKIQKEFIWSGSNPKMKHTTLCKTYESRGLKK